MTSSSSAVADAFPATRVAPATDGQRARPSVGHPMGSARIPPAAWNGLDQVPPDAPPRRRVTKIPCIRRDQARGRATARSVHPPARRTQQAVHLWARNSRHAQCSPQRCAGLREGEAMATANNQLRTARERTASLTHPGDGLPRQELADLVNTWVWEHHKTVVLATVNYGAVVGGGSFWRRRTVSRRAWPRRSAIRTRSVPPLMRVVAKVFRPMCAVMSWSRPAALAMVWKIWLAPQCPVSGVSRPNPK